MAEPTRFICPAPTPSVVRSFVITIAFDFTCLQIFQANNISSSSAGVGCSVVATVQSAELTTPVSAACTKKPPKISLITCSDPPRKSGNTKTRKLAFFARIAFASSSQPGATTHSRNVSDNSVAVAASIGRLSATIPPNAEVESALNALVYASTMLDAIAEPQGFVCFTMIAVGSPSMNSTIIRRAASRSTKLL